MTHVIATFVTPWALVVWYFVVAGQFQTLDQEAHFVYVYHCVAALAAGLLLCSAIMLRAIRPAVAASIPFAALWGIAFAAALYEVHQYATFGCGNLDLCMPSFGVFLTAVPFALLVTAGVAGSTMINRARSDRSVPATGGADSPRYP